MSTLPIPFPRGISLTAVCVIVAALTANPVAGQQSSATRATRIVPGRLATPAKISARPVQQPADTAAADAAASTTAEASVSPRLQQFQQLTFDRRPSAILKAWATPVEQEVPASDPPEQPPTEEQLRDQAIARELKQLSRDVTLGDWGAVKSYLAALPEDERKTSYQQLLSSLATLPAQVAMSAAVNSAGVVQSMPPQAAQFFEKNYFSLDDVVELTAAAPCELDDPLFASLGRILRIAIERGVVLDQLLARLETESAQADGILDRRGCAKLLFSAGQAAHGGQFLPTVDEARQVDDAEALNLLSRYYLALENKERTTVNLEKAWQVTQAALASAHVDREEKEEALKRAVELSPRVKQALGRVWLEESFTNNSQRGMEIIAAIGTAAATSVQKNPMNAAGRLKSLELQSTATEALLESAPELARNWQTSLNLLAENWLREADISYQFDTSTSLGPTMQRDTFGNLYYIDPANFYPGNRQPNQMRAIAIGELLEIQPGPEWVMLITESLKPRLARTVAQLYLKVNEEEKAFPYIEQLAAQYPDRAKALAEEFLRVWTDNHDPNSSRRRTNPYMYMYGFERKAESIPLTRSKQERNLEELSAWVARLKQLEFGDLDERLLARAFTTCHSSAEVYRLEAIERAFGSLDQLKADTLAELAQRMRSNLNGVWRQPAVQKENLTRRKQIDIQTEVLRGYEVAHSVVADGLSRHPESWSLQLASAALAHDENNYRQEISTSSEFVPRRKQAFELFRRAADLYAAQAAGLSADDETAAVYEQWFYAGLGACDLQNISHENQPDPSQLPLIRESIESLPGESAVRHMAKFANSLFTRMSALSPSVKVRYLRGGFDIVQNHRQAREARKVFDYYNDLVSEIKLESVIDGRDVVGHDEPFGVFVNLRHTREIERESGGFGRYLQNQNNTQTFSYNYGRPTENYRDKFEETVRAALEENFDVLSVTFQTDDVHSRAISEYGWRVTPYAYLLLKSRGPQVDTLPSVQLDLDFLDTSGYVIIPIETPTVPLDAATTSEPRPFSNLSITQTLDERQATEGKLILEIKAVAHGLVPTLERILSLMPGEFVVDAVEDDGVSVIEFDPEGDESTIISERHWMVTMHAPEHLDALPKTFEFAATQFDEATVVYQRYADADLLEVRRTIDLEYQYGNTRSTWMAPVAVLGLVFAGCLAGYVVFRRRQIPADTRRIFEVPNPLTPFTVLGLLRRIEANNGLDELGRRELNGSIDRLERFYFANGEADEPDLSTIARSWIERTASSTS